MNLQTDWNVLTQGYLSLIWCQESQNPENQNKKVSELLQDFKRRNENIMPLNIGSMLSAAYICFVYPQQKQYEQLNFDNLDISKFKHLLEPKKTYNNKSFLRRIRNSLSHAKFEINADNFIFYDGQNTIDFKVTISILEFGIFLNNFFHESKNQFFNLNNKSLERNI